MTDWAWYNEIDEYAAAWLYNLMAYGAIAPGFVDTRSIEDVRPDDLREFTQCHFFAGIGGWSHSLRLAGVPDSFPIWTGSCPCQPFSATGKGAGFTDERHLWPDWYYLIGECDPAVLLGEQVASQDADPWIDLVQSDLEAARYDFASVAAPAAGFGAPHIRDRNYWMAHSDRRLSHEGRAFLRGWADRSHALARTGLGGGGVLVGLGDAHHQGSQGHAGNDSAARREEPRGPVTAPGVSGGVADADERLQSWGVPGRGFESVPTEWCESAEEVARHLSDRRSGPTNGFWANVDWLLCRDGKWRPVEPGTFPLAHGVSARVGRLRAYGNAIVPQEAAEFTIAALDAIDSKRLLSTRTDTESL